MEILIDLIIICIIGLFTFIGYKQGLVKTAIKMLSFVIAIVIALILYKPISNLIIQNTTVDEKINEAIMQKVQIENKEENNVEKDNLSNKIIAGTNNTIEQVSNSFTIKIIETAVILLLYLVARIVLRFISALTELITNLPVLKQINKTGGTIYGFIKGLVIVYAILGIVYLIVPILNTNVFAIIDKTIVAKAIYNNNILLTLVF